MVIEPGRRGLESEIRGDGKPGFKRSSKDSEFIPLRHIIIFPENSHTAIVFAERFGHYGVITFLRTCFQSVFMRRLSTVTMDFDPLTTLSALRNATYKKLSFRAPRRKNPDGTLLDFAPSVGIHVDLKKQKRVKDLETNNGSIDANKVFGVLKDEMRSSGMTAPVDSTGWSSAITVEMVNGQERTFDVDNDGPALVYPLNGAEVNGETVPGGIRPSDEVFVAVCNEILEQIEGQYEVSSTTRLPKLTKYLDWESSHYDSWEVDYYDGAESDGDTARAVHSEQSGIVV
ncbi:hypothetical protein [Glutamicibacter nicotianae]|uniref:hypothetical protein n=1 Tax=Glutamicibacter nicotianae TaxID=37929 RepID=UPI0025563C82|nr:hypothetical protein [Glutamicibacter nicotianae]WIV44523.1 hypothetical protein QQS42_02575 [Glutamicibacter nicotianae]